MANVGVTFDFAAESAKLRTEIDKVRKEVGGLNSTVKGIEKGFKALGGIVAGAFSVASIGAFLGRVNATADGLNDLAGRLGASASGLQSLHLAAGLAGGSAEGVNVALAKMSSTIGDGLAGSKQAGEAFARIGLSAQQLAALKPDEAFRLINQRLSEIPNTFERASAAQDIYGKGAKDIAGLIAEGDAAITSVNQKLAEQGALLSDLDVAKIGVMNDELQFQSTVVTNLGTKFLGSLTPAVGVATGAVADMLGKLGGASEAGKLFGTVMVAAIKIVETAAYGLGAVFETVRATISAILAVIANAVSGVLGALASAGEAFGFQWGAAFRNASDVMGGIGESLQNVSAQARENAIAAGSYAIEAATQIVKAGEIFGAAEADYQRKAAEAAARNAAAQGAGTGYLDPTAAGKDKKEAAIGLTAAQLGDAARDASALKVADVETDYRLVADRLLYDAKLVAQDEYQASALGKLDAFNSSWLGSLLYSNEVAIAAEEGKNATLGGLMGELVSMGIQQGGALGKAGKALAIAQTIWSTGTAVMKTMASLPWPANIGAAALVAAKGAMQLANIKKTNIGSSGSLAGTGGGGVSGSSSALQDMPATSGQGGQKLEQQSAVQIIVQGDLFNTGQETAQRLAELFGDLINNRDLVFINGNSRQAAELRV